MPLTYARFLFGCLCASLKVWLGSPQRTFGTTGAGFHRLDALSVTNPQKFTALNDIPINDFAQKK